MSDLLTIEDVCAKLKMTKTKLYKLRREDATFPKQIKLGPRAVRWKEGELNAWVEAQARAET